jgi:tripartite-type tricarboxylate transporter receptor subunit TctC
MKKLSIGIALTCLLNFSSAFAQTNDVGSFYRGKTLNILIGYSAGGGYDLYARLLARHIGKFIPGEPTLVPQNMPGAGSMKVASFLSNAAAKDGTVIGTFGRGMPIYSLLFTADFSGLDLNYIGSMTSDTSLCLSWGTSKIKNWKDMLTQTGVFGGEGKGADPDTYTALLKSELDAKVRLVTGYPGTKDMILAMERGEIDGICGVSYSTVQTSYPAWLSEKKVNILAQAAVRPDPRLKDVPSLIDLADTAERKAVMRLAVAPQGMARPFAAPPQVPAARLAALRASFMTTLKDPEFLADARRSDMDIDPMSGEELQSLVKDLYASSPEVTKQLSRIMKE